MLLGNFERELSKLENCSVIIINGDLYESVPPEAGAMITFSDGTKLRTDYWRIIKNGRHHRSSFDHLQKYGLPVPIDALTELKKECEGKNVIEAKFDIETGDLVFKFTDNLKLQVLNFTGYEVWEIIFANGVGELSNYAQGFEPI